MMKQLSKLFFSLLVIVQCEIHAQIGIYTVNGDLTMSGAVSTEIQLVNNTGGPGIGHDQVNVVGNLTLAGPLTIVLDGYTPNLMHLFEIASYSGTLTGTFSSVTYPGDMNTWMIDYGLLFPGKVTIYGPQALPVTWTSFDGRSTEKGNALTWQTSSEVNSDYFAIEYSIDGKYFEELYRFRAAGQSNVTKTYNYLHEVKSVGVCYYRLRQVDYDGIEDYSKVISIYRRDHGGGKIVIYPNPTTGIIHFSAPFSDAEVYENDGRMIKKIVVSSTTLDLTDLVPGIYSIKINNGSQTQSIIIKR